MTKREMFMAIANVAEVAANEDMVAFINHEIELLDKRNSKDKGLTKTQKENENIKDIIMSVLGQATEKMTVTEMLSDDRLSNYSNQKISALLRQLVDANKVVKVVEKKRAYFLFNEAERGLAKDSE